MLSVTIPSKSLLNVLEQLQLLDLQPATRRKILRRIGREVVKTNKASMRAQRDPQGRKWVGRKSGKKKRMMRKLASKFTAIPDTDKVIMTWKNNLASNAAFQHQHGIEQHFTAKLAAKIHGKPDYKAPTTRAQAKKLIALGYRIKGKSKKGRRPSIKWIISHLNQGKAGLIIRLLADKPTKQEWDIRLPVRQLVAIDDRQVNLIIKQELKRNRQR